MPYSSVLTRLPGRIVFLISGSMVVCLTSSTMWMTTSPPRSIIPKTGGFPSRACHAQVPPSGVYAGAAGLFFDGLRVPLVPCDDVDLVALDVAAQLHGRLLLDDAFTKLACHPVRIVLGKVQLLGDLLVGQVQPHEVQAQDPDTERLVTALQDRVRQVVEVSPTALALVSLTIGLGFISPSLDDLRGPAVGARYPMRPADLPHDLEALGIIDQRLNAEHPSSVARRGETGRAS